MSDLVSTLDCQDCGAVLRRLSPHEAQRVADRPYDFVVRCVTCRTIAPSDGAASQGSYTTEGDDVS